MTGVLAGHGLVSEGAAFRDDRSRLRWNSVSGVGRGLCSCGVLSPVCASAAERKRWHRSHKAEVAGR